MDNRILKNYIEHTFQRLCDEGKVIEESSYAIFNTGLFTESYSPIYAYFSPNSVPDRQRWFLQSFLTEYQVSSLGVTDLPKRASYFTELSDLIFDTTLDIVPQYEHIFGDRDNLDRLPTSIKNHPMKIQLFDEAIKNAKMRLEANYKTAIPQFYKGSIQLLIPICFNTPETPDVALTCYKNPDGTKYLGSTCLTLEMAYNNARLIAKPNSDWLLP